MSIEQINTNTETAQYLHHDQQGSTRIITGENGETVGTYTYTPYGAIQEHTGTATTSLGYDGQYTNSDTGLVYLRARTYDPTTAQFLSVDPAVEVTQQPYTYAGDNPLNAGDPYGLLSIPLIGDIGGADAAGACGATAEIPGLDVLTCGAAAAAAAAYAGYDAVSHIVNAVESEGEEASSTAEGSNCEELSPNFSNPAASPGRGLGVEGQRPGRE